MKNLLIWLYEESTHLNPQKFKRHFQTILTPYGVLYLMSTFTLVIWLLNRVNFPEMDERGVIEQAVGLLPVTWDWLWSQHNEHRIPLPKLVLVYFSRLTDRTQDYFILLNWSMVLASIIFMFKTVENILGRLPKWAALIPLFLMSPMQGQNMYIAFQVVFVMVLFFLATCLYFLSQNNEPMSKTSQTFFGLSLVGLPLCGASGIPTALMVSTFVVFDIFINKEKVFRRLPLLLFALLSFGASVLYFVGYEHPPYHPKPDSLLGAVPIALEMLTLLLSGDFMTGSYPYALLLGSVVLVGSLLFIGYELKSRKMTEWGPAVLAASLLGLALSIGYSRAPFNELAGFAQRYAFLVGPLLPLSLAGFTYFSKNWPFWLKRTSLAAACLLGIYAARQGTHNQHQLHRRYRDLKVDVAAGLSVSDIAEKHWQHWYPSVEQVEFMLKAMKDKNWAVFKESTK